MTVLTKVPEHVAIIMDGNRRWAKGRGLPAASGHLAGARNLRRIVRHSAEVGVKVVTAYSFSTENWLRPRTEINALMRIFKIFLIRERREMIRQGVRLHTIGTLDHFPPQILEELKRSKEATEGGKKIDLVLALNYGSRDEICRAAKRAAERGDFSEEGFASCLDTAKWPDPELLIRTSGEMRISNFLLWQLSYAEIVSVPERWPEFDEECYMRALDEFAKRARRYGK